MKEDSETLVTRSDEDLSELCHEKTLYADKMIASSSNVDKRLLNLFNIRNGNDMLAVKPKGHG